MIYTLDQIKDSVDKRSRVDNLAKTSPHDALALANKICHYWYRCQSLATVSEYIDDESVERTLKASVRYGLMAHDENRRVTVLTWPLRSSMMRHRDSVTEYILGVIMDELKKPMDPISGWCAADVVDVIKDDESLMESFFSVFKHAAKRGHGWRVENILQWIINDDDFSKYHAYKVYAMDRYREINEWKIANGKPQN